MTHYGDIPVPYPVMWSEESDYFVAECPVYHRAAICQHERPGEGVPRFGRPHTIRQRRAMKNLLCDLCAKPLRDRTKISLSNFGGDFPPTYMLTEVEPLLHIECARLSIENCPSLRRQLADGRMRVRQVFRCCPRPVEATPDEHVNFVPDYDGPPILGLAVMDLLAWRDVTRGWVA